MRAHTGRPRQASARAPGTKTGPPAPSRVMLRVHNRVPCNREAGQPHLLQGPKQVDYDRR